MLSPDLNLVDFHLWEHPKSTGYAAEVSDVHNLQQRIHERFLENFDGTWNFPVSKAVTVQMCNILH
jgi:hypothetical protein